MAIYHLAVKSVSRTTGRSSVAAAAYRCGQRLVDERTGKAHDYRARAGVDHSEIVLPEGAPEWMRDRPRLWNAAEAAEARKDAKTAREYEVALPHELDADQRQQLTHEFAQWLADRHGVAVDVSIHLPDHMHQKDGAENDLPGSDPRNHHAHVLTSTRVVTPEGFGAKTRALDDRKTSGDLIEEIRAKWADLANEQLARAGHQVQIDHRSYERQGIEVTPTVHLGSEAIQLARDGLELDRVQAWRETRDAQVVDLQAERQRRQQQPRPRAAGDVKQARPASTPALDIAAAANTRAQDLAWLGDVVSELEAAQAEAARDRKPVWTGPDGQDRPLYEMRQTGGVPVRGKVRFDMADARRVIQKDWPAAEADYRQAREYRQDVQQRSDEAGFLGRLFSPSLRREIRDAVLWEDRARRRLTKIDRAWQSPKAQKWAADLVEKAERAHENAEKRVEKAENRHEAVSKSLGRQKELLQGLEGLQGWQPTGTGLDRNDRLRQLEEARRQAEEQRRRELERIRRQGEGKDENQQQQRPSFRRPSR